MYIVAYVSSAVNLFSDSELTDLLATSRANNQKVDVTGMLLYKDGNFMQVLEGPEDAVQSILKKVEGDSRHRGVIRLFEEETSERDFGNWSMGFKRLGSDSGNDLMGRYDFLSLPLDSLEFLKNPSKARKLLMSFKKNVK